MAFNNITWEIAKGKTEYLNYKGLRIGNTLIRIYTHNI